jgi:naphtho-gamma-pyrone polyketide synthase
MFNFFDTLDFFGSNGKAPPSWLRPHFNAFLTTLDDYKVRPFAGLSPQTHIVYARNSICKHPDDPRPETRPDDPRKMLWLLNNRTDFSGSG